MKTRVEKPECSAPASNCSPTRTIRTCLAGGSPATMVWLARLLARDRRIAIVGAATDGGKAFRSASTLHPDLVLMDLHLPIVDGAEVARWLKQLQNPPIVFMVTPDASPAALTRSLNAGADAFLVKAADLGVQLQTAMRNFFPDDPEERETTTRTSL